jgi:hypothetical protein
VETTPHTNEQEGTLE